MAKYRKNRVDDAVTMETASIIREIKDPRVSGALITVTGADVAADFKYAKIYYSILGADDDADTKKEVSRGLKSAAGFVRGQLAHRLNLRITPELTFIEDDSMRRGVEIAAKINALEFTDDENEEKSENE